MPTYEYECHTCGGHLEKRQSFSDAPLTTHDNCGGGLRRVIHPAGIVFKGSGFYNTDYKNGSASKRPDSSETTKNDKDSATSESGSGATASSTESSSSASASDSSSAASSSTTPAKSESSSSTPAASTT